MNRALLTAACLLTLTAPAAAGPFSSETRTLIDTDCRDLKLQAASGVPNQPRHSYKLAGTCRYIQRVWFDGDEQTPNELGRAFLTLGAVWNAKDNTFNEEGKLEGGASGKVSTILKCSSDPYLHNGGCTLIAHSNTTPWAPLSNRPQKGRPIGQGHVNAFLAAQFSAKNAAHPSAPPAPAPAPAPAPGKKKSPVRRPVPTMAMHRKGGMEEGVDFFGSDYRGFPLAQPQPTLCRDACMREAKCRAWTYVKPGIKGPQATCFLKFRVPPVRKSPCCISGIK